MRKGIDCTRQITKPIADALKAQGITFVCRYLVPAGMAWKRLIASETEVLSAVGIDILSIYETKANRALGGRDTGLTDGSAAYAEAKIAGQPEGTAIYFAVDFDAQPKEFDIIEAYLKAAESRITGYMVGVYGSFSVCEEMSKRGIPYCWQTYAWSRGNRSAHANVYQYKNNVTLAGILCDLNESYGNEGFWHLNTDASDMTFEAGLAIISRKAGISEEYWMKRKEIDPNFPLLVVKIAKAFNS